MEELKANLTLVEDAFIIARRIDQRSYESQRDRLREDIALAEVARADAALDEVDVEGRASAR